jgi:hypothetical protein
MRKRFGYSATWVPTSNVRIGDVGVLRNYHYERVRNIKDFGIGFETRVDSATGILHYASADSVTIAVKAASDLPAGVPTITPLDARIEVSFNKESAVFFQASDCKTTSIEDQHALEQSLLALYEADEWPEEYVIITELIQAKRATILISSGKSALIEFAVSGNIELGDYTLVDADAGIRVDRASSIGTQIVAEGGLTPLFKAKGVKKRLLRSPTVDRRGDKQVISPEKTGNDMPKPVFFGSVDYDNYA